jgi:hypothetical protein
LRAIDMWSLVGLAAVLAGVVVALCLEAFVL